MAATQATTAIHSGMGIESRRAARLRSPVWNRAIRPMTPNPKTNPLCRLTQIIISGGQSQGAHARSRVRIRMLTKKRVQTCGRMSRNQYEQAAAMAMLMPAASAEPLTERAFSYARPKTAKTSPSWNHATASGWTR
jgi:hypothetical protein